MAAPVALAVAALAVTGSALSRAEVAAFLDVHTAARTAVGVPPLAWSHELAKSAQQYADELAASGVMKHSGRRGVGENLAWNWGPDAAAVAVRRGAQGWADEQADYTPGTPIPGGPAFAAFKAGHYTQMVWRDTTRVGAGKARVTGGELGEKGAWVLVAHYAPPGNVVGRKPY